jgi:hypothetical protein
MKPEQIAKLRLTDKTVEETYGYCIPLKAGGFAWLVDMHDDVYIKKSVEGLWYARLGSGRLHERLAKYLEEIKSGEGNWIICPGQSSYGIDWNDLDYENAAVVKCTAKVKYKYTYEEVKENE